MTDTREDVLVRTFVSLADSLLADYDVIDLLQTLVDHTTELFETAASGITLGPDHARESNYVSVHAIPLRLRGQTIGSLNMFRDHEGALNKDDAIAAQAFATSRAPPRQRCRRSRPGSSTAASESL